MSEPVIAHVLDRSNGHVVPVTQVLRSGMYGPTITVRNLMGDILNLNRERWELVWDEKVEPFTLIPEIPEDCVGRITNKVTGQYLDLISYEVEQNFISVKIRGTISFNSFNIGDWDYVKRDIPLPTKPGYYRAGLGLAVLHPGGAWWDGFDGYYIKDIDKWLAVKMRTRSSLIPLQRYDWETDE